MPDVLPACDLINVLQQKASARSDIEFDYLGRLRDLRNRVAGEVRSINELFPEYTPHDEEYHLRRLFHVADTLIERPRYEEMQATELFVLACGLYSHDWGMAVSRVERNYITTGLLPDGTVVADLALLPDETVRFRQFLVTRGLDPEEVHASGASDDDWREYVRRTHAFRSAERARRFFEPIDGGVAEAVARICEGHWLDFETLQDFTRFPTAFSVLREPLNLAALAVYVRLTDLLDIASDRTPYVIWKFVAPRNAHSRLEWEKHRALQPATCPPYQGGRIVRVDGSTDDHEVYAALEDLRIYCEGQLRGCTDLLARLNDPRHQLDLYHLEWRVAARGFEPVPVRFEFDRERVFEILSDEIYQSDAHVFLRELLQNSIDAIRMRREFLRRAGVEPPAFGLIKVEVEHKAEGDARVIWTDNGVGMDAHIVRNYLAVAGRSFYRSDDFRRLGLPIDPISRFGIGILSCFMVADEVHIDTFKDPYVRPPGEPLRIRIPSVIRQFRVEKLPPGALDVGTRVMVYVQGHRFPRDLKSLQVTRYLKAVAGFVEFPILVTEAGRHTLILHPAAEIDPATDPRLRHLRLADLQVYRTALGFPWEEAIRAQDLETARTELQECSYDLRQDLQLADIEGRITFLGVRDNLWVRNEYEPGSDGVSIGAGEASTSTVRLTSAWSRWSGFGDGGDTAWSHSAVSNATQAIFRDGVLVAEAQAPEQEVLGYHTIMLPSPRQVINLASAHAPNLDVSRANMRTEGDTWYTPIKEALNQRLREDLLEELQAASQDGQRFARLGLFLANYHRGAEFLDNSFTAELPVALLCPEGRLRFSTWNKLGGQPVQVAPFVLRDELIELLDSDTYGQDYSGFLRAWRGQEILIAPSSAYSRWIPVQMALVATRSILEKTYHFSGVRFVEPPFANLPPLVEEVWHHGAPKSTRSLGELAAAAMADPLDMSALDRAVFSENSRFLWNHAFAIFPEKWQSVYFASRIFNLAHPLGALLFRVLGYLMTLPKQEDEWDAPSGRLRDAVAAFALHRLNRGNHQTKRTTLIEAARAVGLSVDNRAVTDEAHAWYVLDVNQAANQKRGLHERFGDVLE